MNEGQSRIDWRIFAPIRIIELFGDEREIQKIPQLLESYTVIVSENYEKISTSSAISHTGSYFELGVAVVVTGENPCERNNNNKNNRRLVNHKIQLKTWTYRTKKQLYWKL